VPSEDANVNIFARTRFWRGTGVLRHTVKGNDYRLVVESA
jgi:hypothetical protein